MAIDSDNKKQSYKALFIPKIIVSNWSILSLNLYFNSDTNFSCFVSSSLVRYSGVILTIFPTPTYFLSPLLATFEDSTHFPLI